MEQFYGSCQAGLIYKNEFWLQFVKIPNGITDDWKALLLDHRFSVVGDAVSSFCDNPSLDLARIVCSCWKSEEYDVYQIVHCLTRVILLEQHVLMFVLRKCHAVHNFTDIFHLGDVFHNTVGRIINI